CYVGGLGCIGLYWFSLDHIYLSILFYFMGLIGYWGSLVFYNSYLPDIAFPEQQDRVSAKGFSLGYFGSVILLIINLAMVMSQDDGAAKMEMMRYSFITVGVWWILFSQ
ncbi:MAG TPA: MFS transporter, partial [Flavobacteriaceae bacterium]|nr:MFS transporter [Flavobacteriaceae bacterium]